METFKKIPILILALMIMTPCPAKQQHKRRHHVQMVYVCTGPKATVYHSSPSCSGLNRCSGDIAKVSLKRAKDMGRRACMKCY